jgi:hypothetical protein
MAKSLKSLPFLLFLLLFAFFASISTFYMRPDFINAPSQQPCCKLHCLNVNNFRLSERLIAG